LQQTKIPISAYSDAIFVIFWEVCQATYKAIFACQVQIGSISPWKQTFVAIVVVAFLLQMQ